MRSSKDQIQRELDEAKVIVVQECMLRQDAERALAAAQERITKLEKALEPFAKVIELEQKRVKDETRLPVRPNEYISVYEHDIVASHFIAAKEALDG